MVSFKGYNGDETTVFLGRAAWGNFCTVACTDLAMAELKPLI